VTNETVLDSLAPDGWAKRATDRGLEDGFEPERAITLMRDYIAPSLDTTISAIGYGMHLFAQNPDQWTLLREDRSLMKGAIEEIVRLCSPIRAFSRVVTAAVEIGGVLLSEGERVLVVYGAANRDPAKFPDPDRFDITRKPNRHLAFAAGPHVCVGLTLARLEGRIAISRFLKRVRSFDVTGRAHGKRIRFRGYTRLDANIDLKD
jgi:cytochrome P450